MTKVKDAKNYDYDDWKNKNVYMGNNEQSNLKMIKQKHICCPKTRI